ncbi:hypothetical protein I553_8991 [Mycobacterium xenopi 4042]|uniref:Uncharacterized protein n=1 Tax=Mycobacterium xenopi 4042 TaxID=1299334 RepID=X8APF2_MYCXE|nr:hypothetical protein I553_8991 [Mycobacterium xenopi 4042]
MVYQRLFDRGPDSAQVRRDRGGSTMMSTLLTALPRVSRRCAR